MPDEHLPKKILFGELKVGKTLPRWSEEAIQGHPLSNSKPPLKTSLYQQSRGTDCTGSSKVARPHKKGAGEYEIKRTSEAEHKRLSRRPELKSQDWSDQPYKNIQTVTLHAFD